MEVVHSKMNKMVLSNLDSLDPVTVLIEEFGKGKAKVIIECWGKSWSESWGAMGGDVKEFFTRTNVDYLVNCFDRGISDVNYNELDKEASTKKFKTKLLQFILERRREDYITKETAKTLWDNIDEFIDRLEYPQHTYDTYKPHWFYSSEVSDLGFDEEEFNEFCYDNIQEVYEKNHDYYYLERIVTAVREAVINNYEGSA